MTGGRSESVVTSSFGDRVGRVSSGDRRGVNTSANGVGQRATMWYVRNLAQSGLVMTSNRGLLCFDARGFPLVTGACEAGDATVIFTALDRADTLRTAALGKILR